jgi:hypothetical protein
MDHQHSLAHYNHTHTPTFMSEQEGGRVLAFAALGSGGKNLSISKGLFYIRTKGFPFVRTY